MRKPTYAEAYMYKNLLWLAVGAFAFVPFLNNFILQFVYLFTYGDIAYTGLSTFISVFQSVIGALSVYTGLGVLCVCVINFGKNAKGVIRLAFLTHLISFLSSVLTCSLYSFVSFGYFFTDNVLFQSFLLLADAAASALVYLAIYLFILKISKKYDTVLNVPSISGRYTDLKHPTVLSVFVSGIIYSGVQLLIVIYNMITDFTDPSIGPPMNASDVIFWVIEYLSVIVSLAIGLLIMGLTVRLSLHYLKKGK